MEGDSHRALNQYGGGVCGFDALGKTWRFSQLTQEAKNEYASWCRRQALAEAQRSKAEGDLDLYRDQLAVVTDQAAAGHYRWGSAGFQRMVQSREGVCKLAELTLKPCHPEVTPADVGRLWDEAGELLGLALNEVLTVPNLTSPAAKPGETAGR